jgi:hypothetical protein
MSVSSRVHNIKFHLELKEVTMKKDLNCENLDGHVANGDCLQFTGFRRFCHG